MGDITRMAEGVYLIDDKETAIRYLSEAIESSNLKVVAIITNDADMQNILSMGMDFISNGETIKRIFAPKPTNGNE